MTRHPSRRFRSGEVPSPVSRSQDETLVPCPLSTHACPVCGGVDGKHNDVTSSERSHVRALLEMEPSTHPADRRERAGGFLRDDVAIAVALMFTLAAIFVVARHFGGL